MAGAPEEVKLYFEEIPAVSDDDEGAGQPSVVFNSDELPDQARDIEKQGEKLSIFSISDSQVTHISGPQDDVHVSDIAESCTAGDGAGGTSTQTDRAASQARKKRSGKSSKKKRRGKGKSRSQTPDTDEDAETMAAFDTFSCRAVLTKAANKPAPRGGATMCSVGGWLLLFGGASREGQHFDTVHALDVRSVSSPAAASSGSTSTERLPWQLLTTSGDTPPARGGHTAVVHEGRIFVFGGMNMAAGEIYNDLHMLDLCVAPQSPDAAGGGDCGSAGSGVLALDVAHGARWNRLSEGSEAPAARTGHHACILNNHSTGVVSMLVCGGSSPETGLFGLDELFTFDLGATVGSDEARSTVVWNRQPCSGQVPSPREMGSVCCLPPLSPGGGGRLCIVGGRDAQGVVGDLCILDLAKFEWLQPFRPDAFRRCSAIVVPFASSVSTSTSVSAAVPSQGTSEESTTKDTADTSIMVMGGWDGGTGIFNDLQVLELSTCEWRGVKIQQSSPPPPRFAHAACSVDDDIFVFGGMNAQCDLGDLLVISRQS